MTNVQLTQRIAKLEKEMAEVRARMAAKPRTSEEFVGMFRGDRDFKEAMAAGAAYRASLRPRSIKRRTKK